MKKTRRRIFSSVVLIARATFSARNLRTTELKLVALRKGNYHFLIVSSWMPHVALFHARAVSMHLFHFGGGPVGELIHALLVGGPSLFILEVVFVDSAHGGVGHGAPAKERSENDSVGL